MNGKDYVPTNDIIEKVFKDQVELVKLTCHNILRQPMYSEKLQKTVIFHMRSFKEALLRALEESKR